MVSLERGLYHKQDYITNGVIYYDFKTKFILNKQMLTCTLAKAIIAQKKSRVNEWTELTFNVIPTTQSILSKIGNVTKRNAVRRKIFQHK